MQNEWENWASLRCDGAGCPAEGWRLGGGGNNTIFFLDVLYFMISSKCLSVNQNIKLMVFCLLCA